MQWINEIKKQVWAVCEGGLGRRLHGVACGAGYVCSGLLVSLGEGDVEWAGGSCPSED